MPWDSLLMKILLNFIFVGTVNSAREPLFKTQTRWKTFSTQFKLTLILSLHSFPKKKKKSYENNSISKELYKLMIISFQEFLSTCRNTWVYDNWLRNISIDRYWYLQRQINSRQWLKLKYKLRPMRTAKNSSWHCCIQHLLVKCGLINVQLNRYLHKQPKSSVWTTWILTIGNRIEYVFWWNLIWSFSQKKGKRKIPVCMLQNFLYDVEVGAVIVYLRLIRLSLLDQ